jgi:hypothetical protein
MSAKVDIHAGAPTGGHFGQSSSVKASSTTTSSASFDTAIIISIN